MLRLIPNLVPIIANAIAMRWSQLVLIFFCLGEKLLVGSINKSLPIILQKIPQLSKLYLINSNLLLSFILSSPSPLKIDGEFANDAATDNMGY